MDLIIYLAVAYFIARLVVAAMDAFKETYAKERDELLKKVNDITHRVKIETHHGIQYWFDEDSDLFLGQGQTLPEIINHVKSRFPTHMFFLNQEDKLLMLASKTEWQFTEFKL